MLAWQDEHRRFPDLRNLSELELRRLLRDVMIERERRQALEEGREPRPGGRFRLRWGKHQPNQ